MNRYFLQSLGGGIKLMLDIIITFLVFSITFFTMLLLGQVIFNIPAKDFLTAANTLDNPLALKYLVTIQSLALFFFPSLSIAWFFSRPHDFFHSNKKISLTDLGLIIAVMIAAQGAVSLLGYWNSNMHLPQSMINIEQNLRTLEQQAQIITQRLLADTSFDQLLVNIVVVALIPAIGEELFFRGVIQRHLIQAFRNAHIAIFTTALIFSFAHFEFFTFLPRFFLGLTLGYIAYWFKNISGAILAHFTNNFLGVMIYFISLRNGKPIEELSQTQKPVIWLSIISIIIFALIFYKLKQRSDGQS